MLTQSDWVQPFEEQEVKKDFDSFLSLSMILSMILCSLSITMLFSFQRA